MVKYFVRFFKVLESYERFCEFLKVLKGLVKLFMVLVKFGKVLVRFGRISVSVWFGKV